MRQSIVQPCTVRKRRWLDGMTPEQRAEHNRKRRESYRNNPAPHINASREYRQWARDDRERRRKIAMGEA